MWKNCFDLSSPGEVVVAFNGDEFRVLENGSLEANLEVLSIRSESPQGIVFWCIRMIAGAHLEKVIKTVEEIILKTELVMLTVGTNSRLYISANLFNFSQFFHVEK